MLFTFPGTKHFRVILCQSVMCAVNVLVTASNIFMICFCASLLSFRQRYDDIPIRVRMKCTLLGEREKGTIPPFTGERQFMLAAFWNTNRNKQSISHTVKSVWIIKWSFLLKLSTTNVKKMADKKWENSMEKCKSNQIAVSANGNQSRIDGFKQSNSSRNENNTQVMSSIYYNSDRVFHLYTGNDIMMSAREQ